MKLTRYQAQTAAAILNAIPFTTPKSTLDGATIAAIAIAIATLQRTNGETENIVRDIATRLKPDDYDTRLAARSEAIKKAYPDPDQFDPEAWKTQAPDPEFETIIADTDAKFQPAALEVYDQTIDIPLGLTPAHLATIAAHLIATPTLTITDRTLTTQQFIRDLAHLFTPSTI